MIYNGFNYNTLIDLFLKEQVGKSEMKWPRLLFEKLSPLQDNEKIKHLRVIVEGARKGMNENPNGFIEFFKIYDKLFDFYLPDMKLELKRDFAVQDTAGFSYLIDHDENGMLTYELMTGLKNLSEYPEIYNYPKKYGPMMNTFAKNLGLIGPDLTNLIFNK